MITLEHYFQGKPHTAEHEKLAIDVLDRQEKLVQEAEAAGAYARVNCPNTGTEISGSKGGHGDGGFRVATATSGAVNSAHKEARAVDRYDPLNRLDRWLDSFEDYQHGGNSKLEEYDLYREAPVSTDTWCHLTTRRPGSGRRTFMP